MAQNENLVRLNTVETAQIRSADSDGNDDILFGHFAVFETWTEINSSREGHFMERVVPGAFSDTLERNAKRIRVLFDHGQDPSVGNKPLGVPLSVHEDTVGAAFNVKLFDVPYVNELKPAIRAGQMGSSFRFSVRSGGDQWVIPKKTTDYNPKGLKERTVFLTDVYEFGPVPFPAYADATSGLRSMTDDYFARLLLDPATMARYIERVGPNVASKVLSGITAADGSVPIHAADGPENGMAKGRSLISARSSVSKYRRK
jgi:HK97 family phage prohead protease